MVLFELLLPNQLLLCFACVYVEDQSTVGAEWHMLAQKCHSNDPNIVEIFNVLSDWTPILRLIRKLVLVIFEGVLSKYDEL